MATPAAAPLASPAKSDAPAGNAGVTRPKPSARVLRPRVRGQAMHGPHADRKDRAGVWLEPDEREDLQLLAMAEGLTESSLIREQILELLRKKHKVIEEARAFRQRMTAPG